MSEFNKKAESKGPKIYRVRDIIELFSAGAGDIRIHKTGFEELDLWQIVIFWHHDKGEYAIDSVPNEVLQSLVLSCRSTSDPSIEIYI